MPFSEDEFWAKGVRIRFCLVMRGDEPPTQRGYRLTTYQGKKWVSSRLAWMLIHGPIPEGMFVCHTCDNPPCIEPSHLFLGTDLDNMRDKVAKGRHRSVEGVRHHNAKLTEDQVRQMRALYASGVSSNVLAVQFGLSRQTAWKTASGKAWRHVR